MGRDTSLRFGEVHSASSHLHSQKVLDRILLLEEPLREHYSRRPALGPYVVQRVRATDFQNGTATAWSGIGFWHTACADEQPEEGPV